jgi:hypothetical protein
LPPASSAASIAARASAISGALALWSKYARFTVMGASNGLSCSGGGVISLKSKVAPSYYRPCRPGRSCEPSFE